MPLGILFWVLMIISLILGWFYPVYSPWLLFALLFILGWRCFGFPIQGGGPTGNP